MVRAAFAVMQRHPNLFVYLVGDENQIRPLKPTLPNITPNRYRILHAPQVVTMDDRPSQALRSKPDSSMSRALTMLAAGEADGMVSAGHTGALMAFARRSLNMCPTIAKPAISTVLPSAHGFTRMLDLGANVDCDSETLYQFGIMGAVLAKEVDGHDRPTIGLLNVGKENNKGSDRVRQAANLLAGCPYGQFVGFVEGQDIFCSPIDVVVCDGFVGNSVLKAAEGLSFYFAELVQKRLLKGVKGKILKYLLAPRLRKLRNEINPDRYNGASFVGFDKVVVKSHGHADEAAAAQAMEEALKQIHGDVPKRIWRHLEKIDGNEEDL